MLAGKEGWSAVVSVCEAVMLQKKKLNGIGRGPNLNVYDNGVAWSQKYGQAAAYNDRKPSLPPD